MLCKACTSFLKFDFHPVNNLFLVINIFFEQPPKWDISPNIID